MSRVGKALRPLAGALALSGLVSGAAAQSGEPIVYEVEGVRVVQSVQPERELVAARLYLLGGAQQLVPETAGAERMILLASGRGTESFPGNTVRDAQVATGSRYTISTGPDWSVIGFAGLAEEFERSWRILAERVARPTLDAAGEDDRVIRRSAADRTEVPHPIVERDVGVAVPLEGQLEEGAQPRAVVDLPRPHSGLERVDRAQHDEITGDACIEPEAQRPRAPTGEEPELEALLAEVVNGVVHVVQTLIDHELMAVAAARGREVPPPQPSDRA
jgi:hypothetical protein